MAAPSCGLPGFSLADDSALRAKLEGCASAGCHGSQSVTAWTVNLSGSVQNALAPLADVVTESGYSLVDERDPDCSLMPTEVTDRPVGNRRQPPLSIQYWSGPEIDCFRFRSNELATPVAADAEWN